MTSANFAHFTDDSESPAMKIHCVEMGGYQNLPEARTQVVFFWQACQ